MKNKIRYETTDYLIYFIFRRMIQKNVNRALRSLPYPATVPGPGGVSCPLFWGGQL